MEYRYSSPLGELRLTSDGEALTGLWFTGQRHAPEKSKSPEQETLQSNRLPPTIEMAIQWLDVYFSGQAPGFTPPLHMAGTPFQKAVWELLLTIPYGQTRSYGALAAQLAEKPGISRMAAQAVGGAVGRNPISLIVPCHRVVGANGRLVGYAGGLDRKAKLLALERKEDERT